MQNRSQFINIFLVVLIVMASFGLIMPLIPYYVAQYGGSEFLVGLLVASYAAAQFIGAPLLGRLSDRRGRRPLLAVSLAGTVVSLLLLGLAEPIGKGLAALFAGSRDPAQLLALQNTLILGVMFFSRILGGILGGMITVAQAYIADITDQSNRTMGMGLLGSALGLGLIVGPLIGGVLSQWGLGVPALVASGLATINLLSILLLLPESLTAERKAELARQPKKALFSLAAIARQIGRPRLGPLLVLRLGVSLAMSLFMALFTLWSQQRLGLDARNTSYLMAYNGVLSVAAQMALIAPLTKRYSQSVLITASIIALGISMFLWGGTSSVGFLLVVLIPFSIATGVVNTVIGSAISWAVAPHEMGDALGTSSSLESLSRVIAPTLGGWLLGSVGTWAPGVLGGLVMAAMSVLAWQKLIAHPDPPLEPADWLADTAELEAAPEPA